MRAPLLLQGSEPISYSDPRRIAGWATVVVVTYNSEEEIKACLTSIELLPPGTRTVVVDNASTDATRDLVRQYAGVHLLEQSVNRGFAAGVNAGIEQTSTPYVLVINPDVTLTATAVEGLCEGLDQHPEYAALGCRMHYSDGTPQVSARPFPTVFGFVRRVLLTLRFGRRVADPSLAQPRLDVRSRFLPEGIATVDWVLGGCMLIRRAAYADIGPFDEKYFLYYEDIDWCFRAHVQQWRVGIVHTVEVVHEYKRASSHFTLRNRLSWVHLRSAIRFFVKFCRLRGISMWA